MATGDIGLTLVHKLLMPTDTLLASIEGAPELDTRTNPPFVSMAFAKGLQVTLEQMVMDFTFVPEKAKFAFCAWEFHVQYLSAVVHEVNLLRY